MPEFPKNQNLAKKIKLLHIITNLELGGAQKHALQLIGSLDKEKYQKHFICNPSGLLTQEAEGLPGVHVNFMPALQRTISPWRDLRSLFYIFKYIRRHRIDIVHTHSSKAGIIGRWAAYLAGVRVIIHTVHGWSFHDYLPKPLKQFYLLLERIAAVFTDSFIGVSLNDIQKGLSNNIGKKDQYQLIRYGISPPASSGKDAVNALKQEFGIGADKLCVGMVACLKPQKNPIDFIRLAEAICKKRSNAVFLSVGDGALRGKMQSLIYKKNLQKQVRLCGWRRDMGDMFSLFDIIVLPSLWEGLPIALLEAMSFAKPVVAYNSDGTGEIIRQGENGYLIEPKDIDAFVEKVEFLLSNKDFRQTMGKKAKEFFAQEMFTPEEMLKQTENLYQRLLKIKK